jgi:hypothetical protein
MEFIQINPQELPMIVLLVVVGGALSWRFLGLLEGGLGYLAETVRDFSQTVKKGNLVDEKQTAILERLDQHIQQQTTSLEETGVSMKGFTLTLERFVAGEHAWLEQHFRALQVTLSDNQVTLAKQIALLAQLVSALEQGVPLAAQESLRPILQASLQDLVQQLEAQLAQLSTQGLESSPSVPSLFEVN